jgi:hypothetical protein
MSDEGRADQSYDVSVFQAVTDELEGDDPKVAERKIKRMLRRRHLGEYEQDRIDTLRALRNDLRDEILKFQKSSYYQGTPDLRPTEHFDDQRMVRDFSIKYPLVRHPDIGGIIGYALYYYYLR